MKRLNGEVKIQRVNFDRTGDIDDYVDLAKQVTGRLHLRYEGVIFDIDNEEAFNERERFTLALDALPNLGYASQTIKRGIALLHLTQNRHGMVFEYRNFLDKGHHSVSYRPALLNGRHVVDVLRAVCGPADVSEAELDRVRREATEEARDREVWGEEWEGVWETKWWGPAIAAEE